MKPNIQVLTHSSIRIEDNGKVVYFDPFEVKKEYKDADLILVTHAHHDHFSPDDIRKVAKPDTLLVYPETMKDKVKEESGLPAAQAAVLPGTRTEAAGCPLEVIPAYNIGKLFHPKKAGGVGYVLQLPEESVYVAGDTDITEENRKVRCDVALVPAGGTYTMTAAQAAELVNAIKPKKAIPTHYGSVVGKPKDGIAFRELVEPGIEVEIQI